MNPIPEVGEDGRYAVIRTRLTEDREPIPEGRRMLVLRRDNFRCVFCGRGGRLEVDHIIPWSAGGSDDLDNLRTLCHGCNQERSNYKVVDDTFRRLPNGGECVYCQSHLIGELDTIPIYCIVCNKKAPGLPFNEQPYQTRGLFIEESYEEVSDELWAARERAALVARVRAAAPPTPMPDEDDDDA